NLRKAQVIVRRHCQELGVNYLETSLITSYRQALRSLHRAGAPLRRSKATV
ncbi:acyl-CoA desaturase, partial [Streptomyces sp. NPDC058685]